VKLFGLDIKNPFKKQVLKNVDYNALANFTNTFYDGDKFYGGFGPTKSEILDYWTLRRRSAQLFNENLYARGIIRRLITNEINTGLTPETRPDESIIGLPADSLVDWSENVENRYAIWGKNPKLCDWNHRATFGAIQRTARTEALVGGDVLVVLHQSPMTLLPKVQLIRGERVRTPLFSESSSLKVGHRIKHGVELDLTNRVIAHWVTQDDGTSKRVLAFGPRSGRRISWLVYGTDKRLDDIRGTPLLSICLQSLKEIDRYRDSTQRKVALASTLAIFMKKTEDKMGTLPLTGGAVRREKAHVTGGNPTGTDRTFNIAKQIPGLVLEELQHGEEPVGFNHNTDVNFGPFEQMIVQGIAWGNEMPPEILMLSFSSNYSASQAATNEFKIYLNRIWMEFGDDMCNPVYVEWLLSETLTQKIESPGLLEAWRDPMQYDVFGAWIATDWYGSIKPSIDVVKQAKGSKLLVDDGWSTNAREARITTGTKFSQNIKRLKHENELKVEAMRPLVEFQAEFAMTQPAQPAQQLDSPNAKANDKIIDVVKDNLDDILEDQINTLRVVN